ncbi:MAG: TMEM43 family protein [Hydrogenophaga sp.]|nr:TMEM43 family protein [Hydrogenophaga sp.]
MSFTETTRTSWLTRLKNALVGAVIGIVLVVVAIWALVWNEGRSIKAYRALTEGAGVVVTVSADEIAPLNEGKLIHITGKVTPDGIPTDSEFGISADGAVAIRREVEMYQWVEKSESRSETKLGGSEETVTTYTYTKEWKSGRENSGEFRQPEGHENPDLVVDDGSFAVESAKVGAFAVSGENVAGLGKQTDLKLTEEDAARAEQVLSGTVQLDRGGFYVGLNPAQPRVGDLRIQYSRADLSEASFVAAQSDGWLKPFTASNGREIFLSESGKASAAEMFDAAQAENTMIMWLIRVGGMIGLMVGFSLFFSILGVIADVVPIAGSLVRFGTGMIAFVLTVLVGPLVIAIGWFAYRPLLSLGLLVVGGLIAFGVVWFRRRSVGRASPTAPSTAQ